MNFSEVLLGKTHFSHDIHAYQTKDIVGDSWLYFIGGIHGDEMEGSYILNKLIEWLKTSFDEELPLVIIPILNVDGCRGNSRFNAKGIDLNANFPMASKRQTSSFIAEGPLPRSAPQPECLYLKAFMDKFPPQMVISFHSSPVAKIMTLGEQGKKVGEFFAKYCNYELESDYDPQAGSLESYIFDFFLGPTVTIKVPKSNAKASFHDIWLENADGLKQLLKGQAW